MKHLSQELRSIRRYGTATILVTIALVHAYRVHVHDLTQWKGGGFGMFSTVDSGGARDIKLHVVIDGEEYLAQLPDSRNWRDLLRLSKRLPSSSNLDELLRGLAREAWFQARRSDDESYQVHADPAWLTSVALKQSPEFTEVRHGRLLTDPGYRTQGIAPLLPNELRLDVFTVDFNVDSGQLSRKHLKSRSLPGLTLEELAANWGCSLDYLRSLRRAG